MPSAQSGRSSARSPSRGSIPSYCTISSSRVVCLVAYEEGQSPRAVLDELFRRSVSDGEWRERYEPLLA